MTQQNDLAKTANVQPQGLVPSRDADVRAGEWVACGECVNGVVACYSWNDFEGPGECRHCNGGALWRYPSGVLALYPGGPLRGRATEVAAGSVVLALEPSRSFPLTTGTAPDA